MWFGGQAFVIIIAAVTATLAWDGAVAVEHFAFLEIAQAGQALWMPEGDFDALLQGERFGLQAAIAQDEGDAGARFGGAAAVFAGAQFQGADELLYVDISQRDSRDVEVIGEFQREGRNLIGV